MYEKILNKMGLFYFENEKFNGILYKHEYVMEFEVINQNFKSNEDYLLINGYVDNKKISFVMFNYPIFRSVDMHMKKDKYRIHSLFIGNHFKKFNELKFKNSSILINNISTAINLSSFQHYYGKESDGSYSPLTIKLLEDYVVNFEDFKLNIRLNPFYETRSLLGNGESVIFKEKIMLIFEYDKKQDIDRISNDAYIIQNLFTFITGKSRITELKGFNEKFQDVDMIIPILSDEIVESRDHPSPIQLDESNIGFIIKKWFKNYQQLNSVYDLYFSLENSHLNPISLFLTYAQMLESYHRQTYEGDYVDIKKFKKISKKVRKFLKEVDEIKNIESEKDKIEFINKTVASIKFSYEFTFNDRILQICADLEKYDFFNDILEKFTNDNEDKIDEFTILIKNNRNYYTHYGKRKENVLGGKDLIELNEALDCMINLIFLKEFNFSVEEINKITKDSRKFMLNTFVDWM